MLTFLTLGVLTVAQPVAAQSQGRVTVEPAKETAGHLLHGVTLDATHGSFPVLIKLDGIAQPFVGSAYLQAPGRAVVSVVSYGDLKVSGYVVSPNDRKQGLPMRCIRKRDFPTGKECVVGELNDGDKLSVIFPDGLDIISRK
ncbi:MAG: hypothetical protein EKK47_13605 [Burkholderiales bacterium]|nr:MAG: hypothetical protein EKK47_13605 [Burkholderiales bacterium]